MLDGLDLIDWGSLEHSYGPPAGDVPDLIRALASGDAGIRERARIKLWGRSDHFPMVDSVTSPTIPFLLELLGSPTVQDKSPLLVYLGALAWGEDRDFHHPLFPELLESPPGPPVWDEDAERTERMERSWRQELGWWEAARRAVVAGTAVYLTLLDDAVPEIRWSAAYTLGVGKGRDPEIVKRLEHRLRVEPDDRVAACILLSLACVGGGDSGPSLERYLDPARGGVVRVASAMSLARIAGRRTPPEAIRLLVETITDPGAIDQEYLQLPWTDREGVVTAASAALSRLGAASAEMTVPRILDALDRQRRLDPGSITMVAAILAIAFDAREKPREPGEVSAFQRAVLRRLAGCERAWDWGNVVAIFHKFALPGSRDEMLEFVRNL